jgi:predicted SAM-dependent methyltransferase
MDSDHLTAEEETLLLNNAYMFRGMRASATLVCCVPDCNFPLNNMEEHTYLTSGDKRGPMCNICREMYWAVQIRKFFVDLHADWEKEQERKKKIQNNNSNYF